MKSTLSINENLTLGIAFKSFQHVIWIMNPSMMKSCVCFALTLLFLGLSVPFNVASAANRSPQSTVETHRVAEAATYRNRRSESEDLQRFGWYAGLHAGAVLQPDMEIRGDSLKIDVTQKIGYVFDMVVGYKVPMGLRMEGELSYRNTDTDSIYFVPSKIRVADGIGGAEAASALFNAWYDFDFISDNWYPYAGLGFGYSTVWIDPGHSGSINTFDSSASGIVGQVGVGMVYRYTRDLEISFDFRYLRSIVEMKFYEEPRYPGSNDATYQTLSFMLGFRGFF